MSEIVKFVYFAASGVLACDIFHQSRKFGIFDLNVIFDNFDGPLVQSFLDLKKFFLGIGVSNCFLFRAYQTGRA